MIKKPLKIVKKLANAVDINFTNIKNGLHKNAYPALAKLASVNRGKCTEYRSKELQICKHLKFFLKSIPKILKWATPVIH